MAPTILRDRGYRFFFFSREESRPHVHVLAQRGEAKFWLEPRIELARNHRLPGAQLQEVERIIEAHYDEFIAAWWKYFSR